MSDKYDKLAYVLFRKCRGAMSLELLSAALRNSACAALHEAAQLAEDCIANNVTVLSAGEVGAAIRNLAPVPIMPNQEQTRETLT